MCDGSVQEKLWVPGQRKWWTTDWYWTSQRTSVRACRCNAWSHGTVDQFGLWYFRSALPEQCFCSTCFRHVFTHLVCSQWAVMKYSKVKFLIINQPLSFRMYHTYAFLVLSFFQCSPLYRLDPPRVFLRNLCHFSPHGCPWALQKMYCEHLYSESKHKPS